MAQTYATVKCSLVGTSPSEKRVNAKNVDCARAHWLIEKQSPLHGTLEATAQQSLRGFFFALVIQDRDVNAATRSCTANVDIFLDICMSIQFQNGASKPSTSDQSGWCETASNILIASRSRGPLTRKLFRLPRNHHMTPSTLPNANAVRPFFAPRRG